MESKYYLKLTPIAAKDLDTIYAYIKDNLRNSKAANDLFEQIEKSFDNLRLFPQSSPKCLSEKGFRKMIVKNFIAFYKIDEDNNQVVVYRVLYGMMDYHKFL